MLNFSSSVNKDDVCACNSLGGGTGVSVEWPQSAEKILCWGLLNDHLPELNVAKQQQPGMKAQHAAATFSGQNLLGQPSFERSVELRAYSFSLLFVTALYHFDKIPSFRKDLQCAFIILFH
ncbi:hypothetical protein CEXT_796551 [Caerostris extrusa]|uniref:Uncharacterized protein n=1 Tax=Caerostris extrusa TaxID=172846 RepID=A0AAV4QVB0_CAEEX|nr:hypothetical protein CEXT_796551 [Caerostris extrusa]